MGVRVFLFKGMLCAVLLLAGGAAASAGEGTRACWGRDTLPDLGLPVVEPAEGIDSLINEMGLAADTLSKRKRKIMAERAAGKVHSPRKATILAMVLPGSGQIYNREWWKVPILYAGVGAAVYGLSWNASYYKKYRTAFVDYTAYLNQIAEDQENDRETPYPADNSWDKLMAPGRTAEGYSESMRTRFQDVLQTKKDRYKRYRDMMYIVCAGIYAIQIIDAVVFAHFYDFEINEDLSMKVSPSAGFSPVCGGTVGLTLSFKF